MNRHPMTLILSLICLFLAVIGLAQLQKVWKYIKLMATQKFFTQAWAQLLALVIGLLIGYVDLHNNEVWAALMLLLPITFTFGFLNPQKAWQGALLMGAGIPLAYLVALLAGYTLPCHPDFECPTLNTITTLQTFMALVPALVGAYSGAGLRWGLPHFKAGNNFGARGE